MYLDRKLSGNNILNYFTLPQRDNCTKRPPRRTSGASVFRYLPTKCTYGTKQKVNAF